MISHITIRNFRGVIDELDLDLGQITLLSGRNGLGKTTIFDAIDWCLFGATWRLGDQPYASQNLYTTTNDGTYVALSFRNNGTQKIIERNKEGAKVDGINITDKDLTLQFISDPDILPPYVRDPASHIRRFVYLPQSDIRQLLTLSGEAEKEALFQSLLGVPNASLVESAIRRVSERINQRERALEDQLNSLRQDIREIEFNIPPQSRTNNEAPDQIIDRVKAKLDDAASVNTVEGLLSLCRTELDNLRKSRSVMTELNALLAETAVKQTAIRTEIDHLNAAISIRETELDQALRNLTTTLEDHEFKEGESRAARNRMEQAVRMLEDLRHAGIVARQINEARNGIDQYLARLLSAEALLRQAEESLANAEEALKTSSARLELERHHLALMTEWRNKAIKHGQLRGHQNELIIRLGALRSNIASLTKRANELETEREALWQSYQDSERRYNIALSSALTSERLTSLLAEVASLAEQLNEPICPLCGAHYPNRDELFQHIHSTADARNRDTSHLSELRGIIEEAFREVTAKDQEIASHSSSLIGLRREEEQLSSLLQQQSDEITHFGGEDIEEDKIVDEHREIEARIEPLAQQNRHDEERVTNERITCTGLERQLSVITGELNAAQAHLETLLLQFPTEFSGHSIEMIEPKLSKTEEDYKNIASLTAQVEKEEHVAALKLRELSNNIDKLRSELTDFKATVAGHNERLRQSEHDIATRLRTCFQRIPQDIPAAVIDELQRLTERLAELEHISASLEELLRINEQRELASQLSAVRSAETRTLDQLDEIKRAQFRFDTVVRAIRNRSQTEARETARHLKAAIQECLTVMYPHGHLDQVELNLSTGEILLFDRFLSQPVAPHLYSSTGQLNVLALAIFMGMALRQRMVTLDFLLLDEPVQNLDDVHFLAFITLVKRAALLRQIIFSTADTNIAELFTRQMKSTWTSQSSNFVRWDWQSFDPKAGPTVRRFSWTSSRAIERTAGAAG